MLLYSALYYFITAVSFSRSYVLLAANIEDFRTIAKQVVPDSMADEILEMAKDAISNSSPTKSFALGKQADDDVAPEPNDSGSKIRSVPKNIQVNKDRSSREILRTELSFDELVEKVKERLQDDLTEMAVTAKKKKSLKHSKQKKNVPTPPNESLQPNESSDDTAPDDPPRLKTPSRNAKHLKKKLDNKSGENNKYNTDDKKYVAETFEAQPPKYLLDLGEPVTLQESVTPRPVNNNKNIKREKKINRPKHITTTPQVVNDFVGVDMAKTNDSYEDYVVPAKDNDFLEPKNEKRHKTVRNDDVKDAFFSDEQEARTKAKKIHSADETINYDKKMESVEKKSNKDVHKFLKQQLSVREAIPSVVPLAARNTEQGIETYLEKQEETVYVDDTERPVTEELKARSASISFNEYTIAENLASQVMKDVEGNKITRKKRKQATVIPKRDMYKVSSPNYLVKIPIIGEKYRFDEPIPEEDQEPEKVIAAANTGLINGRVLI